MTRMIVRHSSFDIRYLSLDIQNSQEVQK